MYDAICVGGSVAGAATAAFVARAGGRVLILEKKVFPRHKACGEGLLPPGVRVLRRLGFDLPEATRIRGIQFRVQGRAEFLPFPDEAGWAVRRWILDAALLRHAESMGAEVRTECVRAVEPGRVRTDRGEYQGRWLIGADGANSNFHRAFKIPVRSPACRVGLSMHARNYPAQPDRVEVIFFDGGEAYIAPVDSGLTLISLLLDRYRPPEEILPDVKLEGPVLASAPLARSVDRIAGESWMLVGDSAGTIDPITGEGMSVALVCAEMAAETVVGRQSVETYVHRALAYRKSIERLTRWVLFAARHPWVARRSLRWGTWLMRKAVRDGMG